MLPGQAAIMPRMGHSICGGSAGKMLNYLLISGYDLVPTGVAHFKSSVLFWDEFGKDKVKSDRVQ
jgi:hypothetical protein